MVPSTVVISLLLLYGVGVFTSPTDLEDFLNENEFSTPNHLIPNKNYEETSEIHFTGEKSCKGPGSDPYRNLVFNGKCTCKRNVQGTFCNECKRNSFDLSPIHPHGCVRCFCSGLSSICQSSNWFHEKVKLEFQNDSQGIELVFKNHSRVEIPISVDPQKGEVFVGDLPQDSTENYYWKLPEAFLGDRLASYGGYLNFTIDYSAYPIPKEQKKWLKDPLAVIKGNGVILYYRFKKRYRRIASHFLPLLEQSWYKAPDQPERSLRMRNTEDTLTKKNLKTRKKRRRRARRKDLMQALTNVSFILLKANYRTNVQRVSLLHISMSHAIPNSTSTIEKATLVEQCDCPEGYGGLSCQYCSSGYTKSVANSSATTKSKRFINNTCRPCECNGHAESCHEESGKCLNCKHNTTGDYCQFSLLQCDVRGTHKHEIMPNVPSRCICKTRVQGDLCDTCKPGYFNLETGNEKGCSKCWCNGVTFKCESSQLQRFQIRIQPPAYINVGFLEENGRRNSMITQVNNGRAIFYYKHFMKKYYTIFWILPKIFTGNLLKSYGGHLEFTVYHTGACDRHIKTSPLVEVVSFKGEILEWKFSPILKLNSVLKFSIRLIEHQFTYYGQNVERSMFLRVISSTKTIRIYIPVCRGLRASEINGISLDTSVDFVTESVNATEVEVCDCPVEYSGLSCENCSPGYVKDGLGKKCIRKSLIN